MTDLETQLRAFAAARGGTYRTGPQPQKPVPERKDLAASTSLPPECKDLARQAKPATDPMIDYTDDYSLWCRTHRGE